MYFGFLLALVLLTESPDPPIDIKISEIESRTVKVSWSHPFSGNSQILKYLIYLKQHLDLGLFNEQMRNISVPATEKFWIISDLMQSTNYTLTLTAVNSIGESEPSIPKYFQTEEEGKLFNSENGKYVIQYNLSVM